MYTDGGVEDVPGVSSGATAGAAAGVGSTSSSVVKSSCSSAERALKGGIPRSRVSPSPGWAASSSDWSENWDDVGDDLPERDGSCDRERD